MCTCDLFMSTCNIIMWTCHLFMSTCNIIMSKCDLVMSTCYIIMSTCDLFLSTCNVHINKSHVDIFMLHVGINKSHVNIIILHVDIIYLACRGQKNATIVYLLRRKTCARVWLNFSIFLLCQVKIPDEKKILDMFIYWEKNKQTSSPLLLATVSLTFSSSIHIK